ncbi:MULTISPECIES: SpvB/TcaC N-terminal domain-containing protein [Cyanophyceae]|uniref:Toxin n=1 Tax=Leptolyngbya subtilissima DQ-A4 TaxID=2933933 RepID=A0ABV0K9Z7_9CYAN|nr:SpvB/TcaC N-terminal domain-containing protein [Nodosilinea sp. FACHB-141]MBD2114977.1 toxin [Nodosilinea sp. FACHB-141]
MPDSPRGYDSKPSAEADQSYFSPPPAISLPKGGGAIKGMGEKFAANPVTGTGSMSVPITTSSGRSGVGPQLSLAYDSGAGNGIFGLGWNLSLPSITRKTDKGLPRYRDKEESDVFILSGAEDLVPISSKDNPDEPNIHGYCVQKYRPRIEGLFARIERWTKLDSGEAHWRSITKDNITTLYGQTTESRVANPNQPNHVFSWLICESYDDKGNAIRYEYERENSDGINTAQAHERNRTSKSRSANRYLKRIHYGNQTPRKPNEDLRQRKDWLFETVLDYGEHEQANPQPSAAGAWTVRNDPFSSYRAGFEVRTYRLCQRVLMFHHIPNQEGVEGYDGLVRSTDFTYSYEQDPTDVRNPIYSLLKSVTQTGYNRNSEGGYTQKSLPPLKFTYSEAQIDETVHEVDSASLENLPQGLDGTRYQWVDMDGEGLSGILTEQGEGWFYKRNLSPINVVSRKPKQIEAKFAPVELVESKPAIALANGAQFLDLAGDGQLDVVALRSSTPGFYERKQEAGWESFVAFRSLPVLDWDDPNLKFIDLDGDGHSDILITEDNCFVWHSSLAEDGFSAAERVSQPWDEEKGPRVVFADGTQSIYLADMSGDGLTDIVRIRNGEVCYWSNLGYGRFGAKVTMDNAPWFDAPDIFDQRRIRVADIDGSGTTDILYLSSEGVQVYFNQSGNSWSAKRVLRNFPPIDSVASVTTVDLLGNGTACLVWSSPLPNHTHRAMRYIDLLGGQKPHLLLKTVNNLGAETVVQYAPSTKFYLQDRLAGKPWITKLPFPVHVVERVETCDRISGNRFVSRYAYHHGYFDGVEREFRGFGFVEQWDTEEYGVFQQDSTNALEEALHVPPVLTKTWFHTGAYFEGKKISQQFEHEYYREPNASGEAFQASLLPDTILPTGLTAEAEREAARSLKGSVLRQEVYALDRSEKRKHPYSVTESNYAIRQLQPRQGNQHAVFFIHPLESIAYHYERNPDDPRIAQQMTLEVDGFGNVLKSVAIAYPRRKPAFPEQGKTLITYTENRVTNKPDQTDWYRIGVPIETRTYELTGYDKTGSRFQLSDFVQPDLVNPGKLVLISNSEVNYEDQPTNGKQRRVIEWVQSRYRPNSQANTLDPTCLALGEVESLALPCESFKLAFTPGLLTQIYGSKISTDDLNALLLAEGRYTQEDGNWWISSGRQAFDPDHFYAVTRLKDPFEHVFQMEYDPYTLLMQRTEDPLGNVIRVENDYRVLQPKQLIDPNGNRAQVAFDALGMVAGTAVMGKEPTPGEREQGDSLANFQADLSQEQIDRFLANPLGEAGNLLGTATTRIIYDLERYKASKTSDSQQPTFAATLARETHVSDLKAGEQSKVQVSFLYSDGFGREIQTVIQAEPGLAPVRDTNGILKCSQNLQQTNPRWVGTGRTIFNNKGKPVKQYEPFFSPTHLYEDEEDLVECGVTPILHYDPLDRVIRTDLPDGTFSKVEFDAWHQETWDENDTVDDSQWLRDRQSPAFDGDEPAKKAERRAARLTQAHAKTFSVAHLDTLGRTFLTIADNGTAGKYPTHVTLDIEGNQRLVTDARNNRVLEQEFDLLGHVIRSRSMDAGDRWMLNNVAGKPIRGWDSREHEISHEYDALQRPTHLFVKQGTTDKVLAERIVYGESHPQAQQRNLRGKVFQHYDGAGVVSSWKFDFKGNLLRSSRQLAVEYTKRVDWLVLARETDPQKLAAAAKPLLEQKVFDASTAYDALNRPVRSTSPDHSVMRPVYNEANLLEQVYVRLRGAEQETLFVQNINYNAKGQRELIEYGNGVKTAYSYDRLTFRLTRLFTTRVDNGATVRLQDLNYTYDPVGNITEILDNAQQDIFFEGAKVSPVNRYEYDAIYRLIKASGREHIGQAVDPSREYKLERKPGYDYNDFTRSSLMHPNDAQAMRDYIEEYQYDSVGNILRLSHQIPNTAAGTGWSRDYTYEEKSNRLLNTTVPGLPNANLSRVTYDYDAHGNMIQMPHLSKLVWNFKDQLQQTDLGGGGTVHYVYDASGQRVRKIHQHNGNTAEERIYLGGFEIYQKRISSKPELERKTLHIMDDQRRIALVETKTFEIKENGTGGEVASPKSVIRYQLDNHLGSASLELDETGAVVSYEEYYSYGSTSYQAGRSVAEVSLKRYRYIGKERDEETGLNYHEARYYASWLGRWVSCDPIGITDGVNYYGFVRNNPIRLHDPTGTQSVDPDGVQRTPGTSGHTIFRTKEGTILLPEPETTLSNDPAFKAVAEEVLTGMKSNNYETFRYRLNQRIREILVNNPDHPLTKLFEDRGGTLFWKKGTAYAGQALEYAHIIAKQSIKNLGASEAAAVSLENLNPVGGAFHRNVKEVLGKLGFKWGAYGHPEEVATKYMTLASEEAKAGTKAMADELATVVRLRRAKAGQRGFVTVGGMVFALVVIGTTVYAVSQAQDKKGAIQRTIADFVIGGIIFKLAGGGVVGVIASGVIGMCSDDQEMNRKCAEEEAKADAIRGFMLKHTPSAVQKHWYGDDFDPTVYKEVEELLFNTQPTVLKP